MSTTFQLSEVGIEIESFFISLELELLLCLLLWCLACIIIDYKYNQENKLGCQ